MKESIAVIRWVVNAGMVVAMLGVAWLGYKFVTEPGYLAEKALGVNSEPVRPQIERAPGPGNAVVTRRLPQARSLPQASPGSAGQGLQDSMAGARTTRADSYAPQTTATGEGRTRRRAKQTSPPSAYQPPVAQRKVVRVGE